MGTVTERSSSCPRVRLTPVTRLPYGAIALATTWIEAKLVAVDDGLVELRNAIEATAAMTTTITSAKALVLLMPLLDSKTLGAQFVPVDPAGFAVDP